ncbi:inosine/xanthosine triphosphatase [Flexibacterium corallicola]|uniref:inosine/xanthosine triphosphatase n=1 Tax=Flexibacterium corallicola TaxID=3037259 RepID=UPI00286F3DB8|nr:inosine/xanthosine triphosphatase [Pseudovibrio sp. M1P-2-3]
MKVVVASQNPVKVSAVQKAFSLQFPECEILIDSVSVASDVPDQPLGEQQTRQGAVNRVHNARASTAQADFWVGLEGGISTVEDEAFTFAWMAILDRSGKLSTSRSLALPLPAKVMERVGLGEELGNALDTVFGTKNIKHKGGAFGLLTDNYLTRQSVYIDTVFCALLPFKKEAYL